MDALIFVALVLFVAVFAAWVVLPSSASVEEKFTADALPMLQSQQQT